MKTIIIGGGLSGLAVAEELERKGTDYLLVEARNRFGGRILSEQKNGTAFDLGPAWFWPGQPRVAAMVNRLGLVHFDQYSTGDLTFEDETGRVHRGRGFASMQGSWRLEGGLERMIQSLVDHIPEARRQLGTAVTGIARSDGTVNVTLEDETQLTADRVVLALPPRIAAQLNFEPALPQQSLAAMQSVPTWMAGQAKAIAIYNAPFWRDAGLSGDAMSRAGPMVEIHDTSPLNGRPYALFGFIGVPPAARLDQDRLKDQIKAQLMRLYGDKASSPSDIVIKDWAFDPYTATEADRATIYAHPSYGMPNALHDLWDGQLQFAGTEVARTFGGFIEGALEAAEAVSSTILQAEFPPIKSQKHVA